MLFRKAMSELLKWKKDPNKRALLITGARQIGKTYLVREFAKKKYENCVEINFIHNENAHKIFSGNLDAKTIYTQLTANIKQALKPGKTLIFLDEIQECPNARTAIKFLVEDGRFDIIESGSLLGVNYKHVKSFPVGFEQKLQMYPMDFEEFCIACGTQDKTFAYLKECFENKTLVLDGVHEEMLSLFRLYTIVGGMPAAVQKYLDTEDIGSVISVQKDINSMYRNDITQYALLNKEKITAIYDNIPSQLDDKNRRFQLATIDKNARMRSYEDSFVWLKDAGVALPCFNLKEPKIPLKINEQSRLFKLFLSDCGLLSAASMGDIQFEILNDNMSVNMGSILENVFAQELVAHGFELRYFNKQCVGELDFVVQKGSSVLALEIKSGKNYTMHAALNNALEVKDWSLDSGIVFCKGNVAQDGKITYLPWYMIMFLEQNVIKSLKVKLDLKYV